MAQNNHENYSMQKLGLGALNENGRIIIPKFQRGIVWSKQHRKEFIETVKSGDPFGVVLVYRPQGSTSYILIDGLQRLSTLKAYMDNPIEFIDENDRFIDKDKLRNVFSEKYKSNGMQVPQESKLSREEKVFLKKLISILKQFDILPDGDDLWSEVSKILEVDEQTAVPVLKAFNKFYKSFIENLKLPELTIHAIAYEGERDRLPKVFETLNTSSVSLTKYEIFSSQWPITKIQISDEELVDKVWSKYANLKNSSTFDVDVTRECIAEEGMTLFEYCFGLSELISNNDSSYSFLFNKNKKSTDPTGFEILSMICGLAVNKADELYLPENLGKVDGNTLKQIKNAVIDSINTVADALRNWVFDLNNTPIKNSSTYQMYYMIISVFTHKYRFDKDNHVLEVNEDVAWLNGFKANAFKWYLFHQLEGFWNKNRQVTDLKNIIEGKNHNVDYSKNISEQFWRETIETYCKETRDSLNTRIIPNEIKLLLNCYYKMLIDEDLNRRKYFERDCADGTKIEFDIEHIVPFNKFSHFGGKIPMSVLGNLCYLGVKDNRSKRDKTIYEYSMDRPALTFNDDFLKLIDYPKREELSFIDCPYEQFVEPFESLTSKREQKVINKFISLITLSR